LRRVGVDAVAELFDLRLADVIGNGLATGFPPGLDELRRRIDHMLAAEQAFTVNALAVDGRDVMRVVEIPPGPRVGAALEPLLQRVLDDPAHNRRETLLRDLETMRDVRSDGAREA